MTFKGCQLKLASFYGLDIKTTLFDACNLQETDFSTANLSQSVFKNCDFMGAIFERTNLSQCDFRSSYQFTINPEINNIKKAKFDISELQGLLQQYDIVVS